MLFNSFEFIFVFLPVVFVGYFLLCKISNNISKVWLLFSSLFFYGWWNPKYLPLILVSLFINFFVGSLLGRNYPIWKRKVILTIGIVFNVCLLGYFKYYDFFISNINFVLGTDFDILHLLLPLAISFYTFQQIAYLVDSYRLETKGYNLLNYSLFVTFFPQLIAGPIVHHKEVMSQFQDKRNNKVIYRNMGIGLFIFAMGLFKKVGMADTFAVWASEGYNMADKLSFIDAWITSLSYTFQLYFDFSGYSDMAIGLGLLFNIRLPINFNSPYKALSIQDFWKRWHMTLTNFLTRYIYIPLGGNRKGVIRTYINILIIYLVSGFWHGAGWTFIVWGLLHGVASMINRMWTRAGLRMNKVLAWFITFQFVNATWVFFRAPDFSTAMHVFKGMVGLNGKFIPNEFSRVEFLDRFAANFYTFPLAEGFLIPFAMVIIGLVISVFAKNSIELGSKLKTNFATALFTSALLVYSIFQLQKVSEFLYFNF